MNNSPSVPPNPPAPADQVRLVAAFRSGDKAAWNTVYRETAPRLLAWARTLTHCSADAEDLVQETFVAAFLGADTFDHRSRLLTWLFGIAMRRHRDKARKRRFHTLPFSDDILPPLQANGLIPDALLPLAYREEIAKLPDTLRESFVLVVQLGFTHKEAAYILRAPEGTVKWRVIKATRQLRAALTDFDTSSPLISAKEASP